ncbi:MAG: pentapeptide repeat-containing protein, partial [Desulfuromonadales bacterium]|nr:pentapeptide repeat-containing protein [Desulfuromonadales bacterium]
MKTTAMKKMVCTLAAFILVAVTVAPAFAGSQIHLRKWKSTGACKGCNLSNLTLPVPSKTDKATGLEAANLTGATFASGVTLAGYNMKYATCNDVKFNGASLKGANVTAASFQGAVFGSGDLSGITGTSQTINFKNS